LKIIVEKSEPLSGVVNIGGAKNAVLPILAATLLTDEPCIIEGVPALKDVDVMCQILSAFGAEVEQDIQGRRITTRAKNISADEPPRELMKAMRASIAVMGALLARLGAAKAVLPGGCAIGDRPIDLHIKGFESLGAEVELSQGEDEDCVVARVKELSGAEIYLDFASVGATENIMTAAVLGHGTTIIENAAQEPEIVDLANFLNKMGAHIRGAGTESVKIEGVPKLHGAEHTVIPDRVEAATFMLAAAITRGSALINNTLPTHAIPVIAKLRECGVRVKEEGGGLLVDASAGELKATNIKTLPYPGFPTDMQPQFMAFLTTVSGASSVTETVFENRFMHIEELKLMGADIQEKGRRAFIHGGTKLQGASVRATDLRAGAALVLAGLAAEGQTTVRDVYHIDRGYEDLVGKLAELGARIRREKE